MRTMHLFNHPCVNILRIRSLQELLSLEYNITNINLSNDISNYRPLNYTNITYSQTLFLYVPLCRRYQHLLCMRCCVFQLEWEGIWWVFSWFLELARYWGNNGGYRRKLYKALTYNVLNVIKYIFWSLCLVSALFVINTNVNFL